MKLYGPKLREITDSLGDLIAFSLRCPGCRNLHVIYVQAPSHAPRRDTWGFNWRPDAPTFTPSLLMTSSRWEPPVTPENLAAWRKAPWQQEQKPYICHSFITDGQIQFLDDCTHNLAGQTVDIPDMETPC